MTIRLDETRVMERAARLADARQRLGYTIRQLARQIGTVESNLRKMEGAQRDVQDPLLAWIEGLAEYHRQNPPPILTPPSSPQSRRRR